jgi:chorismate dehydratase
MSNLLQVGRIPFLVCAPFFHKSLSGWDGAEFTDGTPADQNQRLRERRIDLSPSSSLEYALQPEAYDLLPGICTAGRLEIRSVRLFTQKPWSNLHQQPIQLSSASATSNALVKILSHQRYGVQPKWIAPGSQMDPDGLMGWVAIGDEALTMAHRGLWTYSYDLAVEWQQWHHLPFAFGLWLVQRQATTQKAALLRLYSEHLRDSVAAFRSNPEAALSTWLRAYPSLLPVMDILDFYSSADYTLTDLHLESLGLFYALAQKEGLISAIPTFRFVT